MAASTLTVVGARPQFIKAAVVSRALAAEELPPYVDSIIHTGQHFDHHMSQVFFDQLDIPSPAVNLDIHGSLHGETTGTMLAELEREMLSREPDAVVVYGDTNTTLAAALAASKLHIPLAHVEAGLRSYNRRMPEELNRVLTDHASDVLFCPSRVSVENLAREGIHEGVHVVGDTMCDAVLYYAGQAPAAGPGGEYAVATVHRAENTDDGARLGNILDGLASCPIHVVMSLHPRTKKALRRHKLAVPANVELVEPMSYLDMIGTVRGCSYVLTDSGGLQKEAFFLGRPCITLRDETEWTELVDIGANRVVGTDPERIQQACSWARRASVPEEAPYGDGTAGKRIVSVLASFLAQTPER